MKFIIKQKIYIKAGFKRKKFAMWGLYVNINGAFVFSHWTTIKRKYLAIEYLKRNFYANKNDLDYLINLHWQE